MTYMCYSNYYDYYILFLLTKVRAACRDYMGTNEPGETHFELPLVQSPCRLTAQ